MAALITEVDDMMLIQVSCRSAEVLSTKTKGSLGSPALGMWQLGNRQALVQELQFGVAEAQNGLGWKGA